jgi:hypothetical protein
MLNKCLGSLFTALSLHLVFHSFMNSFPHSLLYNSFTDSFTQPQTLLRIFIHRLWKSHQLEIIVLSSDSSSYSYLSGWTWVRSFPCWPCPQGHKGPCLTRMLSQCLAQSARPFQKPPSVMVTGPIPLRQRLWAECSQGLSSQGELSRFHISASASEAGSVRSPSVPNP